MERALLHRWPFLNNILTRTLSESQTDKLGNHRCSLGDSLAGHFRYEMKRFGMNVWLFQHLSRQIHFIPDGFPLT